MIGYRTAAVAAFLLATGGCAASEDYQYSDPPDPQPTSIEAEYVGICVDPVTQVRIDDDHCGDHDDEGHTLSPSGGGYFIWMNTMTSPHYPPTGQPVPLSSGSRTIPKGASTMTRMPSTGGTVTRGGIGVGGGGKAGPAGGGGGGKAGGGSAGS